MRQSREKEAHQAEEPPGPKLVEVLPLVDRVLMLHFDEGHVVHHKRGQPRTDERVVARPLDTAAAGRPESYRITSADDPAYARPRSPESVGRKSKGTDFAWFVDRWENGHAVNTRPDHANEHWLYLQLKRPMAHGKTYTIDIGSLASNGRKWTLKFDEANVRSEAVHVNLLGYVPAATQKLAYVYHWKGDRGSLDLGPYAGRPFRLIDQATGKPAFTGKLVFRAAASGQETFHKSDSPPDGNFLKADVYECDFSSFARPGQYRVAVDGIGASFPFRLDADVYRVAFKTVARALYHNRSGIALVAPYTEFTRPAPHNPKLTPGFAGKLIYTTVRYTEWGSEGGVAPELLAHSKGPIESAGWYQDAGDWDSYETHLRVAQELLLAYELAPRNFRDSELNIPESGNGVPDLIDEAAWLPRFGHRLRHELLRKGYGTGGIGLRIAGDAFGDDEKTLPDGKKVGQGSWEDVNRTWAASGEDPWSTYRYAGVAAQLAFCLKLAKVADPEGIDWTAEAREAFAWAKKNTRAGDLSRQPSLKVPRAYAAAALFRQTGEKAYETQFLEDTADITPTTGLWDESQYGPELYALAAARASPRRRRLRECEPRCSSRPTRLSRSPASGRCGGAATGTCRCWWDSRQLPWCSSSALLMRCRGDRTRRGRNVISPRSRPRAITSLAVMRSNMTWATGLGPRHPAQVFHMDAWYNGKGRPHSGIIPYGPWRPDHDVGQGPWDVVWPFKTVYPPIDSWPGNERWFDNRCSPLNSEFTIHQNTAPAAAIFGLLCAPGLSAASD